MAGSRDPLPPGLKGFLRASRPTTRLRLLFLGPLALAIIAIGSVLIGILYRHEHETVREGAFQLQVPAIGLYEESLRESAAVLRTVLDAIGHDARLRTALARQDRAALLRRARPVLEDLRADYGITHLYFTGPDRVNLLRVHDPPRHGDVIDRLTTRHAALGGRPAHGVELGPLGTFTLRVVVPWRDGERLLGFVELGMEVDHALRRMRELFHVETYVVILKKFLRRESWEEGMRLLGRAPDWDRFPEVVLSLHGAQVLPAPLAEHFTRNGAGTAPIAEIRRDGTMYRQIAFPLHDAGGQVVGQMVLLADVSARLESADRAIREGGLVTITVGGGLLWLFYWLVGRIGRRIERTERTLQDLASRDRLTGAWNRRRFDEMLDQEMARSRRYGTPLTLIMYDIDHFKRVNDVHGHQAGDDLLVALTVFVNANIRDADILARWGGEEFMILAPNIGIPAGVSAAENLRAVIAGVNFGDIGRVTCSFGVTEMEQADTPERLVGRADAALYAAKEAGRNRVRRYEPGLEAGRHKA